VLLDQQALRVLQAQLALQDQQVLQEQTEAMVQQQPLP
jgi:hypothetical protein